jgi:hypothetical protein
MKTVPLLLAAAATLCLSQTAYAGCGPRADVAEKLKADYDEHVSLVGVREGGASLIEIFVSESGTWTVIESFPDGRACSRAFGTEWFQVPKEDPGA